MSKLCPRYKAALTSSNFEMSRARVVLLLAFLKKYVSHHHRILAELKRNKLPTRPDCQVIY